MRKQILLLALLLSISVMAGCLGGEEKWERVDAAEFHDLLSEDSNAFLLDVRTQSEWDDEHIANSYLIPHDQIDERSDELPEDIDAPIYVYCRSGNRSQTASQSLIDLGYSNIKELKTGINGWVEAGFATE
ncbi:MAG TPA: rhodanese-like domain-containing protein [Candidatus Poseidoniales archaeon]|nr:MAG: rhodanese-like domain-containing protein [Euryarchaeota archaeon]HIG03824.1 rhodanese-like domain-containing protein [Candidatus Poseidoniales archaeon]